MQRCLIMTSEQMSIMKAQTAHKEWLVEKVTTCEKLAELQRLFDSEWPDVSLKSNPASNTGLPHPLAIIDCGKVVAGVAFTRYALSDAPAELWINALLVEESHRGQGLAKRLINAAENSARELGESTLYAFTELPLLYQSCGWVVHSQQQDDFVVKTTLD